MEILSQNQELLKLRIAYFFAIHQTFLRRLAIFSVILICVGLYGYSIYFFTDYFLRTGDHEKMLRGLATNYVNRSSFVLSHAPKPLVILEQEAIASSADRYDFVAKIKNSNEKWLVKSLKYSFEWSGGQTEPMETIILPNREVFLLDLGAEIGSSGLPGDFRLKLVEVNWEWFAQPLAISNNDFLVTEKDLIPATLIKDQAAPARLVFGIRNNTLYSFWEAGFKIILLSGQRITAVNYASATKFKSGETRILEAVWSEPVLSPTEIIIEPAIDFFDSENFMTRESSRGELK